MTADPNAIELLQLAEQALLELLKHMPGIPAGARSSIGLAANRIGQTLAILEQRKPLARLSDEQYREGRLQHDIEIDLGDQ